MKKISKKSAKKVKTLDVKDFQPKKIAASILLANVINTSVQSGVLASEITGITPDGNVYNITADKISGQTGFRQYEKFQLTQGDIANLQFIKESTEYSKFVNLVDNQVNINGIVNTMRGNNFYNGHAIFVSPAGMVIGASGVLNVGSFSAITPSQSSYNLFSESYKNNSLSNYEYDKNGYKSLIKNSTGNIIINGKILARNDVNLYGQNIKIEGSSNTNRAGIIAGWQNASTLINSNTQAETLFNSLVNSNIKAASSFALTNGKIRLAAHDESKAFDADGDVKSEINIKNANLGAEEIDISAKAEVDRQERIDLSKSAINIENTNITGGTVSIVAEAIQNKSVDLTNISDVGDFITNTLIDLFDPNAKKVTSLCGTAGKAQADVTVKNSIINAVKLNSDEIENSIVINAIASSSTSENANLLTPTIFDLLFDDNAKFDEYFSNDIYNGFEGARSSAIVTVENSTLQSKGLLGVDISSNASSALTTDAGVLAFILPIGLYGVGSETVSKAIVKNSLIGSNYGHVNVDAISTNENNILITNSSLIKVRIEDALLAMLLNNTVKTETESLVENSIVNTITGLQVFATNLSKSNTDLNMAAVAGTTQEGSEGAGNSALSVVGVMNRSDNDVSAIVKNSTVNTQGGVYVMADSLNVTGNSSSASTDDKAYQGQFVESGSFLSKMVNFSKLLNFNILDKLKGVKTVSANEDALMEVGGAFLWNITNNSAAAKIENSEVKAGNVVVQADTVDLVKNNAYAESVGNDKIGLGVALIINDETNTTHANVDGSVINANALTVDAMTEMPMNYGQLTFGIKLPFKIKGVDSIQLGGNFASEANGKWDISSVDPINVNYDDPDFDLTGTLSQDAVATYQNLKPQFRMSGFFNNLSKTSTKGSIAGISGSVVYNEVKNNTTADITNGSKVILDSEGALTVNAVNSVIGYNAAGMIDFLIKHINNKLPGIPDQGYSPEVDSGTFGAGFNFIWNDYTNNATAKIENSSVVVPNGTVDVNAATEQSYITIEMTGGKTEGIGIDGSIHNQILEGTTLAAISNTTKENKVKNVVSAKEVNVSAGKAKIRTAGGAFARITPDDVEKDKKEKTEAGENPALTGLEYWLIRNEARDVDESITNIIAQGAWTTQNSGGENAASVGIAVGASVSVTDIDRSVKAEINNFVVSADDVNIESNSFNQNLNIEVAAAFSGGVNKDNDANSKTDEKTTKDNKKIQDKLDEDGNSDDAELPKPSDNDDDEQPNPNNPGGLSNYEYEGLKAMGYTDEDLRQIFDNDDSNGWNQNKPEGMSNTKYRELRQSGYSDEEINYYQGMLDAGLSEEDIQEYFNSIGHNGNINGRNPGGVSDYIYQNLHELGFSDEEIENAFSNSGSNIYQNKPDDMTNEQYLKMRQAGYSDEAIYFYQGLVDSGVTTEELHAYMDKVMYPNKPDDMTTEQYLQMRQAGYSDEAIYFYQGLVDSGVTTEELHAYMDNVSHQGKPDDMSEEQYLQMRQAGYSDEAIYFYQGLVDSGVTTEELHAYMDKVMYPNKPDDMTTEQYLQMRQAGYSDEAIYFYQGLVDREVTTEELHAYMDKVLHQGKPDDMPIEQYLQMRNQGYTDEQINFYQGLVDSGVTSEEIAAYLNEALNTKYPQKPQGMSDEKYEDLVNKGYSDIKISIYQVMLDQGYSEEEIIRSLASGRNDGSNPGGLTDEQYRKLHEGGVSDEAIEEYFGSMSEEERNAILNNNVPGDINPYPNKPNDMSTEKYKVLRDEGYSDAEIAIYQELLNAGLSDGQIKHEMGRSSGNSGNPDDNLSREPNPNNPGGFSDWLYQQYKNNGYTDEKLIELFGYGSNQQHANSVNNTRMLSSNNMPALNLNNSNKLMPLKSSKPSDNTKSIEDYLKDPTGGALDNKSSAAGTGGTESAFSLSAAGAVIVTDDNTKVESSISNSIIKAKNSVTLDSNRESKMLNISGGVAGSKKVGAGAAVNVYEQSGSVKSFIDNSDITFIGETPKLDVTADNINQFINIAIGAGAATNDTQGNAGFKAAAGGSASANVLDADIETYINESKINSNGNGKIDTNLEAKSDLTVYNIAGGGSYSSGASAGVSAGAAINYNNIKNTIHSYIVNSTLNDINKLDINAYAENDLMEFAVAGAIMAGTQGSGLGLEFAGSANIDYIHDAIGSQIIKSIISAENEVVLNAESNSENLQVAGSLDYTSASTGAGVNGSIAVNWYENNILAQIDKDSKIKNANNVAVSAKSEETANVIPIGVSISSGGSIAMLAANVGVNIIDNTVRAYAGGNIGSNENKVKNVNVLAYDETTLYTRGGTVALASADTAANIAGSFDLDLITKNVAAKISEAAINSEGDVSVAANSINSLGGTKNSSGVYDRDDITADDYNDKLMQKNDGNYSGINYSNDFSNWNMFYDLSVGAELSVSGAVIVKTIENNVTAEINNADITSNNLNILADDYSIKNIVAGQISASSTAAAGATVLVTNDDSRTSALISNGSDIKTANTINIFALNKKDNNQIVVAGNGANDAAGSVNVIVNNIDDDNHAKIDSSKVKAGTLNMTANEDMNASHIVVSASGSGNAAINVSPLINKYEGETIAQITKSTVNDSAITLNSDTDIKTRDIMVGVAVAGEGAALQGLAIKNTYDTTTKSIIDENSTIDTQKDVTLNANSIANSNNWIAGLSFAGEGASVITNVIINNMISDVETNISNSNIKNAGKITLNSNKDKKDVLKNYGIAASGAGIGAAAIANVIYNIYENDVTSKIYNTSVGSSNSITAQAFSDRRITNYNVGIGATGIGANLLANALVNEIGTDTVATVDAQAKTIKSSGKLTVKAEDNTFADNTMGFGAAVGIGAALGANINLYYSDNLASADVKTSNGGQIDVGSADISAKQVGGLDNTNVGVAAGLVSIAGDVVSIKLGKHLNYTDSEKKSGIKDADTRVKNIYNQNTDEGERNFRTDSSSKLETGAMARVKGNLKAANNINVKAESKLKGKGADDKLNLSNVQVTAGLGTGSVAVRNVQLSNNAIAEIAGGNVESTSGKISVNAVNNSNVEINTVEVDVSGLTFSGGGSTYNNTSETIAQIGSSNNNTTVKAASGIDVVSTSTNKSVIDATNVVVTGSNIVAVDLSENKDSNNTSAQIIGKTDIDTAGKLNIHSKTNTDLSSTKSTVSVSGASMVSVSKNEVEASVISKAIIKDVEGTIKANGIDIVTDYDTMSAFSKANVTAVKLSDLYSGDSSGAKMNAKFTSGIYGEKDGSKIASDVVINNSGKTTIETAKKTGSKGIEAKSEINNVHVSLEGFVAETTAKAENTAESNTILMAKDHRASSLDINSYLDSVADATAGAVKAAVGIGVNLASTDAKDTSNLNVDIAGKNTITGNTKIKAAHNAEVKSDMSSFNFGGLVGGGQKVRINAETTANTTGNIGGEFNANNADIAFTTNRNSVMTKSSGSGGGIVNVSDTKASNKLNGTSTLNIKNYKSDKDIANNNLTISNVSNNTFDTTSHDGSGGFINISQNDTTTELKAATVTNIINSIINSNSKVSYDVQNNTTVKDTASMGGGGFVAVMDNTSTNTYMSGAKLSVQNTTINANDIELKTLSSIKSANNDWVDYVGRGGGFIAENELKLTNNLNQTSEIEIENSNLHADKDAKIEAKTSSAFRQKTDSAVSGFTAMPRSINWLNVTNNNKITVDNSSKIIGDDKLTINFDSDNELKARAVAESNHFGFRDPVAKSYIDLKINNTLQNDGSLQGGNLVDVNYMNNSTNQLTQYAYSEANAAIATTTEDGKITKKITNALNISSNADITSNKDVEISYSSGTGSSDSTIKWKTTSYGLFGIPIRNSKSYSKTDISTNNTLALDGKIVAGQGNSRYMKINKDGDVDTNTLSGFSAGDYTLTGGETLDGQQIKDKYLSDIQIKIDNAQNELEKINTEITNLNNIKEPYETEKTNIQDILTELNDLAENGYTFKNNIADSDGNSDFNTIVQNDLKSQIVGEGDSKLTEEEYTALLNAYQTKVNEIEAYNNNNDNIGNDDYPKATPTISDFLASYSIVEDTAENSAKISTVTTAYDTIDGKFYVTEKGGYTTYTSLDGNKYLSVSNPTTIDGIQTCDEITQLNNQIISIEEQLKPYTDKLAADNQMIADLTMEIDTLTNEKTAISNTPASEYGVSSEKYAIVFNDMQGKGSHILLEGITNHPDSFKGSGTLNVASSGLQIDNYSNRSLIFNGIDMTIGSQSGLIIDGKSFSEFAGDGTNQAVNGNGAYIYKFTGLGTFDSIEKEGAHYISNSVSSNGISGINVNDFYDIFNPFVTSTLASDIIFNGSFRIGSDFNVFNDSGSIIAKAINTNNISGAINLVSTKGDINLTSPNSFELKTNDSIFAGNSIDINADKTDIKVSITAGYNKDLTLTITEGMLSNLSYDPVTGENILINLGNTPYENETNNVKALYKDGKIYLFNINNEVNGVNQADRGKVNITSNNNSVTGTIKTYDGYQKIEIENQTNKPLIVSDITNQKSVGGVYINGIKTSFAETQNNAETNIKSTGKLILDGEIKNNIINDLAESEGQLQITANNGLDINKQVSVDNKVLNSIYNGGFIDITVNNGDANIIGYIENNNGNIDITNSGSGDTNISSVITANLGNISIENANGGDINVTNTITTNTGNIDITNNNSGNMTLSKMSVSQGNINIQNNESGNLNLNGTIDNTAKGNISISQENSGKMTLAADINETDGTVSILNTNSGDIEIKEETGIISQKGDIQIYNEGDSDIHQDGQVIAFSGSVGILNTEGSIYSRGGVAAQDEGGVLIANTTGELVLDDIYMATNGSIQIFNYDGNLYLEEGAAIFNLATDSKYDISIINIDDDDVLGMYLNGTIMNWAGGDINITNYGNEGAVIGGMIQNSDGDINISNLTNALELTGDISAIKGNISINNNGKDGLILAEENSIRAYDGNVSITNTYSDFVMKNGSEIYANNQSNSSKPDINLMNYPSAGNMSIAGKIENKGVNDINIINDGASGMNIDSSADIHSEKSKIVIQNNAGDFNVKDGSKITAGSNNPVRRLLMLSSSPVYDVELENNSDDGLFTISGVINNTGTNGISITNNSDAGMIIGNTADIQNKTANTIITNNAGNAVIESGAKIINTENGNIIVSNNALDLSIKGLIEHQGNNTGIISINNLGTGVLALKETGLLHTIDGNIELTNTSTKGIDITGLIRADKQNIEITNSNGDLRIGSYEDENDNYIKTLVDNIIITQTNGSILNSIVDAVTDRKHQNYDLGNPDSAYKTLISSGNNSYYRKVEKIKTGKRLSND